MPHMETIPVRLKDVVGGCELRIEVVDAKIMGWRWRISAWLVGIAARVMGVGRIEFERDLSLRDAFPEDEMTTITITNEIVGDETESDV